MTNIPSGRITYNPDQPRAESRRGSRAGSTRPRQDLIVDASHKGLAPPFPQALRSSA